MLTTTQSDISNCVVFWLHGHVSTWNILGNYWGTTTGGGVIWRFKVGIQDKEESSEENYEKEETCIFGECLNELSSADFLLLHVKFVELIALFAVYSLALNNLGRHTICMNLLFNAEAWFDKISADS